MSTIEALETKPHPVVSVEDRSNIFSRIAGSAVRHLEGFLNGARSRRLDSAIPSMEIPTEGTSIPLNTDPIDIDLRQTSETISVDLETAATIRHDYTDRVYRVADLLGFNKENRGSRYIGRDKEGRVITEVSDYKSKMKKQVERLRRDKKKWQEAQEELIQIITYQKVYTGLQFPKKSSAFIKIAYENGLGDKLPKSTIINKAKAIAKDRENEGIDHIRETQTMAAVPMNPTQPTQIPTRETNPTATVPRPPSQPPVAPPPPNEDTYTFLDTSSETEEPEVDELEAMTIGIDEFEEPHSSDDFGGSEVEKFRAWALEEGSIEDTIIDAIEESNNELVAEFLQMLYELHFEGTENDDAATIANLNTAINEIVGYDISDNDKSIWLIGIKIIVDKIPELHSIKEAIRQAKGKIEYNKEYDYSVWAAFENILNNVEDQEEPKDAFAPFDDLAPTDVPPAEPLDEDVTYEDILEITGVDEGEAPSESHFAVLSTYTPNWNQRDVASIERLERLTAGHSQYFIESSYTDDLELFRKTKEALLEGQDGKDLYEAYQLAIYEKTKDIDFTGIYRKIDSLTIRELATFIELARIHSFYAEKHGRYFGALVGVILKKIKAKNTEEIKLFNKLTLGTYDKGTDQYGRKYGINTEYVNKNLRNAA